MSAAAVEALLARLYTDGDFLARFRGAPRETALAAGLDSGEAAAMAAADIEGLVLAARSYARKRSGR